MKRRQSRFRSSRKFDPAWKMLGLRYLCDTTVFLNASNPKDKIYAMQNILMVNVNIDYSNSTLLETLYTDFAFKFYNRGSAF